MVGERGVSVHLPEVFCWTKMGPDSGQALEDVIRRKDMEREAGNGHFWWGVGESKGRRIDELLGRNAGRAKVVFSQQKSCGKRADTHPETVLLWRSYIDSDGTERPIPKHVILLSKETSRYYALVCKSEAPLRLSSNQCLYLGNYRNLGSGKSPGDSQVTEVIKKVRSGSKDRCYPVSMMADLVAPYFVELKNERPLRMKEYEKIVSAD